MLENWIVENHIKNKIENCRFWKIFHRAVQLEYLLTFPVLKCRSENPGARFKILVPTKNFVKNQPAPTSVYGKNIQQAEQKS